MSNRYGCDSLIVTSTSYIPGNIITRNESTCRASRVGRDTLRLLSAGGCDSVVVINRSYQAISGNVEVSICTGSTYRFNGQNLGNTGTYSDTLRTSDGQCDSIVVLNLKLSQPTKQELEATFCKGTSYSFGGEVLTEAGRYERVFRAASGCDSTVVLLLEETEIVKLKLASDTIYFIADKGQVELNILDNDEVPAKEDLLLEIISPPLFGVVEEREGKLWYALKPSFTDFIGNDSLEYQVCATACPSYCDTAKVQIAVSTTVWILSCQHSNRFPPRESIT
ncbi:MAG: hypothetical protein HC892_16320 [Saprospiraceae bacterium]|nr:hypothetical protein [Saprospiraceae bacterium]